jgi:hypothetical protein
MAASTPVASTQYGLEIGTPPIRSTGPITFGPDGILFVADNATATIFAIDVKDTATPGAPRPLEVDNLDTRLASFLGCARDDVFIRDMAVHPTAQTVYLSVMRGAGNAGLPVIVRIDGEGALSEVPLKGVPFSETAIGDAPAEDDERKETRVVVGGNEGAEYTLPDGTPIRVLREPLRTATITDLAYVDGMLLVAGASNEEFAATLRRIPFPFEGSAKSNSLEIYHVSHGKYETASPIRTFLPFGGNTSLLASYTCTPIVHFSLGGVAAATQIKGRTVAELGFGNTPLDMASYKKDGEEYLLVSNTRHPLFKIPASSIAGQEGLTTKGESMGVPREPLPQKGVTCMGNLNGSYVLMMQHDDSGVALHSYATSSL